MSGGGELLKSVPKLFDHPEMAKFGFLGPGIFVVVMMMTIANGAAGDSGRSHLARHCAALGDSGRRLRRARAFGPQGVPRQAIRAAGCAAPS